MGKTLKSVLCIVLSAALALPAGVTAFARQIETGASPSQTDTSGGSALSQEGEAVIFADDFESCEIGAKPDLKKWAGTSAINNVAQVLICEDGGSKAARYSCTDPAEARNPRLDIKVIAEKIKNLKLSYRVKTEGAGLSASMINAATEGENRNKTIKNINRHQNTSWVNVMVVFDLEAQKFSFYEDGKLSSEQTFDLGGESAFLIRFSSSLTVGQAAYIDDVLLTTSDEYGSGLIDFEGNVNFDYLTCDNPTGVLDVVTSEHPRIYVRDFDTIRDKIANDYDCRKWYENVIRSADSALGAKTIEYFRNDRGNINDCSTAVKVRLIPLALAAALTREIKYTDRLYKELESAGQWPDWGADAWLCTAHLLYGYALSYDWCYDLFTPAQRENILKIMKEKGFSEAVRAYEKHSNYGWIKCGYNWNQVCNGSVVVAALSVWDEEKVLSDYLLKNALEGLPYGLAELQADGSYSEPIGYWDYGIRHQVKAMAALDSCLLEGKTLPAAADFKDFPGMSNTGYFPIYYNGTTAAFNYGDGVKNLNYSPIMAYLAKKYNKPEFNWYMTYMEKENTAFTDKGAALALLWYDPEVKASENFALDKVYANTAKYGANGMSFRNSWEDKGALFAAMIGGDNQTTHSNLTIGGFVLDWAGKRWVHMYGRNPGGVGTTYGWPNYDKKTERNGRYQYYHTRGEANNTIIANPTDAADQKIDACGLVVKSGIGANTSFAVIDMTSTNDAFSDAKRGMMITDNRSRIIIQDEIKLNKTSEIYWFSNTLAEITISDDGKSALLELDGDKMLVRMIKAPSGAKFEVMDAKPLPTSPDPAAQVDIDEHKLIIHLTGVEKSLDLSVEFVPIEKGEGIKEASAFVPLADWKADTGAAEKAESTLLEKVALKLDTPRAYAKGAYTYVDETNHSVMPIEKEGRTLVPVRFIAEKFGARVDWDAQSETVNITYRDTAIKLKINDNIMYVNGEARPLDVPAQTINDRTLIPLRAMVEAIGKQVMWDERGLIVIGDDTIVTDAAREKLIDMLDIRIFAGGDELSFFNTDESAYAIDGDVRALSVTTNNNSAQVSVAQGNPATVTIDGKAYTFTFDLAPFKNLLGTGSAGVVKSIVLEPQAEGIDKEKDNFIYVERVTASVFNSYPERGSVDGVISDDTQNRWSSQGTNWICWDFGSVKKLHSFALATMSAESRRYILDKIEVSADGKTWTAVYENAHTDAKDAPTIFNMGDTDARYVRVTGSGYENAVGSGQGAWNSYAEARFYESAEMERADMILWGRNFGKAFFEGEMGEKISLAVFGLDTHGNYCDVDADMYNITFESSDPSVVTVDGLGGVCLAGKGTATVRVVAENTLVKREGKIQITVK